MRRARDVDSAHNIGPDPLGRRALIQKIQLCLAHYARDSWRTNFGYIVLGEQI